MLRKIGAFIAGLVVAIVVVNGAERIVHSLHPFPPGMNTRDFAQIKAFVATLPLSALLIVLTGWLIGTTAGTFTAARIGRSAVTGYVLGACLIALGIFNAIIIPQPPWFSAVSFVVYIIGTVLGVRLGAPRRELQPAAPPA